MFKTRDQMSNRHPEWDSARLDSEQNKQVFYGMAAAAILSEPRESESQHARLAPLTDAQLAYVEDYWSGPIRSKLAAALWFVRCLIVYGVRIAGVAGLGYLAWIAYKTFS